MLLSIDESSDRSVYEQIADSVRRAVTRKALRTGDKLPTANEVAEALGVNKHTVLRAYQELRDEGLVDLRRGRGAVITETANALIELAREAKLLAKRASSLGISAETLAALILHKQPEELNL